MASDWAMERAAGVLGEYLLLKQMTQQEYVARALREARAEGMEEAAKLLEASNEHESAEWIRRHKKMQAGEVGTK